MSFYRPNVRDITMEDFFGEGRGEVIYTGRQAVDMALRVAPVYSAVGLLADSFSQLDWVLNKGKPGGASRPIELPPWLSRPYSSLSVVEWKHQLAASLKLRGNAYGMILGDTPSIRPHGVMWLHPDEVSVVEVTEDGRPEYYVRGVKYYLREHGGRLIHIRDFTIPGSVVGLSPIELFMQQFDTAKNASRYGAEYFRNAVRPSGILRYKGTGRLKPGDSTEAKKLFKEATRDNDIATLDGDWDWQTLAINPNEAQFLQTIKASATVVASIFRVAPEDIGGESGNSRSYSNREMDQQVLNVRTVRPMTARAVAAFGPLLAPDEYLTIDVDQLAQPSLLEQARTDTERLRNGTRTLRGIRERDNLPALTDDEIEQWQQWYATAKSASESIAESVSESITKEIS